eukprot:scaffold576_cov260-Pinguiococcus_pyrenoidosus.AAC.35
MAGYRMAVKEAVKFIKENLVVPVDELGRENLVNAAKTSMSSKIVGPESKFFSEMVVNAVQMVKQEAEEGSARKRPRYPVSAIHVLKCHGKSALDSELVNGFALNNSRAAQGMPTFVENARIALLDFNLQRHKLQMGVSVVVTEVQEVEGIRNREMDITKERIQKVLDAGANVILCSKGIDDLCLKYFVEAGAIACRRVKIEDMRRVARATGGQIVSTLADLEGNEAFDAEYLGHAESVNEERVGDGELLYIRGTPTTAACTLVLRGANEYMVDEIDRALHDALMVVKRMLESNALVAGGGAVEAALSMHLESFAMSIATREQMAIAEFSEALLVIPRVLSVNAAQDATELVARLRAYHHTAQSSRGREQLKYSGLDLIEGSIRDNLAAGVVEPAISKIKSLRFAVEAAITILRIDDMIKLEKKQDPAADARRMGGGMMPGM